MTVTLASGVPRVRGIGFPADQARFGGCALTGDHGGMAKQRGTENMRDMVWSLGLVLVVVAVLAGFVAVVRGNPDPVREVDFEAAAAALPDDAPFQPVAPAGLPAGWRATEAALEPGAVTTWSLSFVTPQDEFVGLTQSDELPERAVATELAGYDPDGTATVNATTWDRYVETESADPDVAMVGESTDGGPSTVILIGSAGYDELEEFAGYLE